MLLDEESYQELRQLAEENKRLVQENNQLLKALNRRSVILFWLRIAWILLLIGAPFLLYFYVIEPYFESLGSSFETFEAGLQEVPGWKQFYEAVGGDGASPE